MTELNEFALSEESSKSGFHWADVMQGCHDVILDPATPMTC